MTVSRHVSLITVDDPDEWPQAIRGYDTAPERAACERCSEIEESRVAIVGLITASAEVIPKMIDVERQMRALQLELRPIRAEMTRAVRALRDATAAHVRCACCGIYAGLGHVAGDLTAEPLGHELVCPSCFNKLAESNSTARMQRESDQAHAESDL